MAAAAKGALTLALCLFASSAQAIPWNWKYKTLTSPHFEIIFNESQRELAQRYLQAAEQAHAKLAPLFKETPERTIVVLQDDTDAANGEANFVPYPHIRILPVLPSTRDSIDDYGDWPYELMLHEYTHILNMYPAHGAYVPLKYLIGTVARPNAILPRWYLEGLAVALETRYSTHGRLRSVQTAASARALVLDAAHHREDIARINESGITTWPFGARPYLYGAWWWESVLREQPLDVIETWNQKFARRAPFLLNGPVQDSTGKNVSQILEDTFTRLDQQAAAQLQQIGSGHAAQTVVAENGEQVTFAISPSGQQLAYLNASPRLGSTLLLKQRQRPGQPWLEVPARELMQTVGTVRLRWLDEQRLVFDQLDVDTPDVTFRDLFSFDVQSQQLKRLTTQARAQEPAAAPSGKRIAFVQNDGGRNRLQLLEVDTLTTQTLVEGSLQQRLSSPEFVNEQRLAFVKRELNGDEQVWLFDLGSKQSRVVHSPLKSSQQARWTKLGLLVTDSATQVRNVYRLTNQHGAEALSNSKTEVAQVDYDPQTRELLISELTSAGFRLRRISAELKKPALVTAAPTLPAEPLPPPVPFTSQEDDYSPFGYLAPRYWLPFVFQVEGGLLFQGITENRDPLGRHLYQLGGSIDTVTRRGSYMVDYTNRTWPVDVGLNYSRFQSFLGASGLSLTNNDAGLVVADRYPTRNTRWWIGEHWSETQSTANTFRRLGTTAGVRYSNINHPSAPRFAYQLELSHRENLPLPGYLAYGRTYGNASTHLTLGKGHRVVLDTRAAVAPKLQFGDGRISSLGDRNLGANLALNLVNSNFLLRGYPSGSIVGRKIVNANLEYIFPAQDWAFGMGTFPWFLRDLELAVFVDTMAVDGQAYRSDLNAYQRAYLGQFFTGTGLELHLNTSVAYHLPISFTLGLYYGVSERYSGGSTVFLGFNFGGLGSLQDKTP